MRTLRLTVFIALLPVFSTTVAAGPTDVSLISGGWCCRTDDAYLEEVWLPPRGGLMLGLSRTTAGERSAGFEFLRIETMPGQPVRYVAQPNGGPPTGFALVDSGDSFARFENPEHDFPQRIEYRRQGDQLSASISGPGEDGAELNIPFEYSRCHKS